MKKAFYLSLLVLTLLLPACSGSGANADKPGAAVETYLQAIVEANPDKAAKVACAGWESSARDEVASFQGVKARLDKVSCKTETTSGTNAIVGCAGAIVATYNNEDQTFDLRDRKFTVSQVDGEWLVCGYGQK